MPPGLTRTISDEKRCTATNAKGQRCNAARQVGAEVCVAHDAEARKRYGVGGAQPGSGPKPVPTPISILREHLENDPNGWLAPLLRARDSDDGALALKALVEALDRCYGKAKSTADVNVSGGMTLDALFVRDPLQPTHTPLPEDDA